MTGQIILRCDVHISAEVRSCCRRSSPRHGRRPRLSKLLPASTGPGELARAWLLWLGNGGRRLAMPLWGESVGWTDSGFANGRRRAGMSAWCPERARSGTPNRRIGRRGPDSTTRRASASSRAPPRRCLEPRSTGDRTCSSHRLSTQSAPTPAPPTPSSSLLGTGQTVGFPGPNPLYYRSRSVVIR
jgi:hypothetical protein